MKKNIIWILSWTLVNVVFSMLNQRILTWDYNPSGNYGPLWGWADSIAVMIAGPILGLQGAIAFLLIDYFTLRDKIKSFYVLLIFRIILVILIVLLISFIQKKYF